MSALEPGSDREGGNLGHRSTVSAAISAKRSADALERIEALLAAPSPPPDAGEVRTYREGVREQGQREGFAAAVQWLRDRSAMKPNPPLADAAMTLADQMEQSRIPAAAIRKLP